MPNHLPAATRRRAESQEFQVLESCAFTWIFDAARARFRRVPRQARFGLAVPAGWTAYHRLEVDRSGARFAVALNEAGTRILRAWLHGDPCDRCPGEDGMEMEEL